ncbi:hypothetical protein D3C71_1966310 [compost metagenome]
MLRHHRNTVALAPHLQLLYRRGTEGVPRRQHHRFAFRLELASQLTDGGGFTHAVHPNHQNDIRVFTANIQRLINFSQNFGHFLLQLAV